MAPHLLEQEQQQHEQQEQEAEEDTRSAIKQIAMAKRASCGMHIEFWYGDMGIWGYGMWISTTVRSQCPAKD